MFKPFSSSDSTSFSEAILGFILDFGGGLNMSYQVILGAGCLSCTGTIQSCELVNLKTQNSSGYHEEEASVKGWACHGPPNLKPGTRRGYCWRYQWPRHSLDKWSEGQKYREENGGSHWASFRPPQCLKTFWTSLLLEGGLVTQQG